MKITSAKFIESSQSYTDCPAPTLPEYAFIGRSNVGKSSLINMLTGQNSLARTSSTPGKTQLINHFLINENWYLVDLPGYGWARVSKQQREKFEKLIHDYLLYRQNLLCTFVLIDIRHKPQTNDMEFMQWLGENDIPFVIIFTKADKLSKTKSQKAVAAYREKMLEIWEEMPTFFITSSETGLGKENIFEFVEQTNLLFKKP